MYKVIDNLNGQVLETFTKKEDAIQFMVAVEGDGNRWKCTYDYYLRLAYVNSCYFCKMLVE